jgi:hypothetical protein
MSPFLIKPMSCAPQIHVLCHEMLPKRVAEAVVYDVMIPSSLRPQDQHTCRRAHVQPGTHCLWAHQTPRAHIRWNWTNLMAPQ